MWTARSAASPRDPLVAATAAGASASPWGGHYAAWEQPDLFSAEVRAGFRPMRPKSGERQ
jgi:hypothetical protein